MVLTNIDIPPRRRPNAAVRRALLPPSSRELHERVQRGDEDGHADDRPDRDLHLSPRLERESPLAARGAARLLFPLPERSVVDVAAPLADPQLAVLARELWVGLPTGDGLPVLALARGARFRRERQRAAAAGGEEDGGRAEDGGRRARCLRTRERESEREGWREARSGMDGSVRVGDGDGDGVRAGDGGGATARGRRAMVGRRDATRRARRRDKTTARGIGE